MELPRLALAPARIAKQMKRPQWLGRSLIEADQTVWRQRGNLTTAVCYFAATRKLRRSFLGHADIAALRLGKLLYLAIFIQSPFKSTLLTSVASVGCRQRVRRSNSQAKVVRRVPWQ